jgi:hypothetical protein
MAPWLRTAADEKLYIPLDNDFRDTYPPTPEWHDVAPAGEVPMDCARPIIDTPAKEARCPGDFRVTAPQSRGVSASDTPTTDALPKDARPKDATTSDNLSSHILHMTTLSGFNHIVYK